MSHVFQNILPHAARVKFIDGGARKSDPDDSDDDNFQCCFFFFSSCGCILDRGMGNQLLVRQVAIRAVNSYRGKMGCTQLTMSTYCRYAKCKAAVIIAEGSKAPRPPWTAAPKYCFTSK